MYFTMTENVYPLQLLAPASRSAATYNSDAVAVDKSNRAMFALDVGAITATGTLACKLQEADDDGTGAPGTFTDVTNGGWTTLTQSPDNSNNLYVIDCDVSKRKKWIRVNAVVATAASVFGVTVVTGFGPLIPMPVPGKNGTAGGGASIVKSI